MRRNTTLLCILFIIAANLFTTAKAQADVNDSLELVNLYHSTRGNKWVNHDNWLTAAPVSAWYGVTVTNARVTAISLGNNGLTHTIPASISNLASLTYVDFSYNYPLQATLSSFGKLVNLTYLNLTSNQIGGEIPASIYKLANLTYLSLNFCQLSGTISPAIGKLVNLTYLNLNGNNFNGTIPASIGNLTNLTYLNAGYNYGFTGTIPASIGNLTNLTYLDLGLCQSLSGIIPASIGNLVNLTYLNLRSCQSLSGIIPASIGNLVNLTYLDLGFNQLSGTIHSNIGKLTKLTFLQLYHNKLSGDIPSTIGNLVNLTGLYLGENHLSGSIPRTIGNLVNLQDLWIDINKLSGAIPPTMGNLVNLTYLSLANNHLSGSIPPTFSQLVNLKVLNLHDNQLTYDSNVNFPHVPRQQTQLFLYVNRFTFDGLEFIAKKFPKAWYKPQATITVHQHGNILSVYAGGTLSNNTYIWHKTGDTSSTIISGDSTFTPSQSGLYYVQVTNAVATDINIYSNKHLVLYSDTITYTAPPAIAKNVSASKVSASTTRFSIFPNPATSIIHIQTAGLAIITITNSDGKIILTKTINNNAAINVSAFASGFYYIQNKTTSEVQKIIITH